MAFILKPTGLSVLLKILAGSLKCFYLISSQAGAIAALGSRLLSALSLTFFAIGACFLAIPYKVYLVSITMANIVYWNQPLCQRY